MKKFLSLAALLTLFNGFSTEPRPFGTLMLNGGRLEPVEMSMIEASNEHLNFCFATRFPDNSIYLNPLPSHTSLKLSFLSSCLSLR